MTNWNEFNTTSDITRYTRSWRQEFYTDLGSDFKLIAHLEEITKLDDGTVMNKPCGTVTRSASIVGQDKRVQQIQVLMTELIKEWLDEDMATKTVNTPPADNNIITSKDATAPV